MGLRVGWLLSAYFLLITALGLAISQPEIIGEMVGKSVGLLVLVGLIAKGWSAFRKKPTRWDVAVVIAGLSSINAEWPRIADAIDMSNFRSAIANVPADDISPTLLASQNSKFGNLLGKILIINETIN